MSVHHRSVETRRLCGQIADRITALIEAGGLLEGARLPAERDLASQLGVSRQSLREALIALEIDGRIEIRSKSGIYVCPPGRRGDISALSLRDRPAELVQARVVLESGLTTLAAVRASASGLRRVEEALEDMRDGIACGCAPVEADRRFHLSIAELGGNSVLVEIVGALFDGRHSPIPSRANGSIDTVHGWRAALDEHEAILWALKARDPQAATAAMCHHLESSHRRWLTEPIPSSAAPGRLGTTEDRSGAAWPPLFWPIDSAPNQSPVDGSEVQAAASRGSSDARAGWVQLPAGQPSCRSG
jgi:DNA-binding FadR family transcriptional regulator